MTPYLDPAFVMDAFPELPEGRGAYRLRLEGRRADGSEVFSMAFEMPEIPDGDGESVLVFALPVENGWESELSSLLLSGPGGKRAPMVIATDPATGELRAILRNVPDLPTEPLAQRTAVDAIVGGGGGAPSLEVMVSRGLPSPSDRRR